MCAKGEAIAPVPFALYVEHAIEAAAENANVPVLFNYECGAEAAL
jgi:hypothetical protein